MLRGSRKDRAFGSLCRWGLSGLGGPADEFYSLVFATEGLGEDLSWAAELVRFLAQ